ncbi:hypothetical protein [Streptomyces sp. NPDC002537]
MGWTVLYIAFGVVALWLLGEVLLQYKARLRWRLLAFVGFLGVVAGVVLSSVPVIAVGAIAFAIGQTYVTLSFRRGFSAGWAVRKGKDEGTSGAPGDGKKDGKKKGRAGRRRKAEGAAAEPLPPVPAPGDGTAVLPQIPAYDEAPDLLPNAAHQPVQEYGGYEDTAYLPAATPYDTAPAPAPDGQFDYGQGQYAAYSDPYIGSRPQAYEQYDAYGQPQYGTQPQQQYGAGQTGAYPADAYAPSAQYDMDTPPGGVWVPQQRDGDTAHPPAQQQPTQQQPGHGQGYDGQQYRY